MPVLELSGLTLDDSLHPGKWNGAALPLEESNGATDDRYMQKLKNYAKSLPYSIEPDSKMQQLLNFMLIRLCQCVEAKDYDPGLLQWDTMLTYWFSMKYPITKDTRIRLAKLYFHLATTPGMPNSIIATCADAFQTLTRSKKKLSLKDMRLPWKGIYKVLSKDLFLLRRQFEYSQLSWCMGYMAENARRFFHPAAIDEMLSEFVPLINGANLDSILSSQYYLLTFLPQSHPQSYLPMLFRLWESFNSYMYDERMLAFLSRLAETHVDPTVSDPRRIDAIPDDARDADEGRPNWPKDDLRRDEKYAWNGIYKDVGIFTEHEWHLLMCKCLASMEIPLADGGSLTTGPSADNTAGFEIGRLPKAAWRIPSLARLIVYSMAPDGRPTPPSSAPTPFFTPLPSGMNTPQLHRSSLEEYLSIPLSKQASLSGSTYLGGSKALDSLARLIASTESFFHPTNSGSWTNDLSAFIKYIVYEFNKRWREEEEEDCKTPKSRRLTREMKRELVKSLRTVSLLAIFSQDNTTVSNIQGCLKSMCVMEPDLIVHPILERAIPALESLVETHRTLAVIKALGAIAPALVSRDIYYPGAKYLVQILQLLIPGIDLNDPSKTFCTTAFLVEISQYIKFGDLTLADNQLLTKADNASSPPDRLVLPSPPSFSIEALDNVRYGVEQRLSDEEEDALLKDSTASFADWVTSFIRRVIQLLENLPEEGVNGVAGGASEVQIVDAVTGACSQICVHLSEPLFDLVLNILFDYASTNVRANAVRAIHQLVECVANANPVKTLDKFLPFCTRNIRVELENGASSVRTTSSSSPLPSDATLHWNLAILRGTVYNDGKSILKYRDEIISLFRLLHEKTLSKRGFSWTGKFLSSTLLTLTHTYPTENKFVNPEEWESEEFHSNHHKYWGKLYAPDEVKISWHVPAAEEIDFALQIFKDLVEPALLYLEDLLQVVERNAAWRNDFCRHLSFVRYAFTGIPTLAKEHVTPEQQRAAAETSDTLNEVPEMIASVEPLNSGFCLLDANESRYRYITSLRRRFGQFLHDASVSLRQQGEENTVDAVSMLVSAIRTYMLEYGDSRDSYSVNNDQYSSELSVARLYANQKVWPRAIYVRRARFYHSARLRWNSIERLRGSLEDLLIDDVVEWSMWNYATVRQSAQSLLDSLCTVYDGLRRRTLPQLYKCLQPGTEDDRMKGALWTLSYSVFVRYAISEPTLSTEFVKHLFGCQHNEKPSIQRCVTTVLDNGLNNFVEPCYLVYSINNPALDQALMDLKATLRWAPEENKLIFRCEKSRIDRIELMNEAINRTTSTLLDIANSSETHWRYNIVAIRCLRTLLRRDVPASASHVKYFLDKTHDSNPSMRYYAQRGVMKSLRNIKLRTWCRDANDLVLGLTSHPLKKEIAITPSHEFTAGFLDSFQASNPHGDKQLKGVYCDKVSQGWIAWGDALDVNLPASERKSVLRPWEDASRNVVNAVRQIAMDPSYWKDLIAYLSEETHENIVTQDNISCIKSIFQILEDEPLDTVKRSIEELLGKNEKDQQRAAAELLAGIIGGSKHWPQVSQKKLWDWFIPLIPLILGDKIKTDTLSVWSSFLEYIFYKKDPRRVQPLVDHLIARFKSTDYNSESSFDSVRVLSLFRALYEQQRWKFSSWCDDMMIHFWPEIKGEHEDVRAYMAEIMAFTDIIKWQPKPSSPTAETFVRECRTSSMDFDIMGTKNGYHMDKISDLVDKFRVWRNERISGVRAFQSTYDRVGVTICKWLFQVIHGIHAIASFDYILPLLPELFRFTELNDNEELSSVSSLLLVRMCGVSPPRLLIDPLLDGIFETILKSPSWRVRLKALPLLQVFYFRQLTLITELKIVEILEVLCKCLDDEVVEVREMAARTLSGIIRLSPRSSVIQLKDRFVKLAKSSRLPGRTNGSYGQAIRRRHAAILGVCALVDSFPYTVEKWMPELLTEIIAQHTYDPIPISSTVRKCASSFRKTHQDTWHEDSKRFTDDQLAALSTLLTGSSYYA